MIILITYIDKKTKTRMVSHGIEYDTCNIITMCPQPLSYYKYYFHTELDEYVLKD
jgi:hypothetical protein